MYRQLCAALDAAQAHMRGRAQGQAADREEQGEGGGAGAEGGQGRPASLPPGWCREALLVGQKLRMDMEQVSECVLGRV